MASVYTCHQHCLQVQVTVDGRLCSFFAAARHPNAEQHAIRHATRQTSRKQWLHLSTADCLSQLALNINWICRSLLMEGFAASLRLPDTSMLSSTPSGATTSTDGRLESSDGVFLRLMALHKGRVMLARALRLLYPSPQAEARSMGVGPVRSPPLRLAWALLRNLKVLFTIGGLRAAPGAGQCFTAISHATLTVVDIDWLVPALVPFLPVHPQWLWSSPWSR